VWCSFSLSVACCCALCCLFCVGVCMCVALRVSFSPRCFPFLFPSPPRFLSTARRRMGAFEPVNQRIIAAPHFTHSDAPKHTSSTAQR
jgi:hypothetical protein